MKTKEKLKAQMQSIYPLPKDLLLTCTDKYEYFSYPPQTIVLHEGDPCLQCYFLESGYMRSFISNPSDGDVTLQLFSGPCFIPDFLTETGELLVKQNMETITWCEGWHIPFKEVDGYYYLYPEYKMFLRTFLENSIRKREERLIEMIKDSSKKRYIKLQTNNPDMFQHVPLRIIASYLGITDAELNGIQREILLENLSLS